jgi:hypothetical protein
MAAQQAAAVPQTLNFGSGWLRILPIKLLRDGPTKIGELSVFRDSNWFGIWLTYLLVAAIFWLVNCARSQCAISNCL